MKKLSFYFIALFLLPTLVLTSCKKDNEETFDAQKELTTHLVAQNLDLNTILDGFVMAAPDNGDVSNKYIIDIRTADEFATGHIADAHRTDWANILVEAAKANKDILVVCKTGQTATYASTLLRLSGYKTAKALKWGMSGWNASLDMWSSNTGDIAVGNANWTTDAAPTNLTYSSPQFSATSTTATEILKERVAAVLAEGFKGTSAADVLDNAGTYFVNNYFNEADYTSFGHVKGAYRINPLLVSDGQVNFLDPSKTVVTYCYTGQTSGAITAYLRVIGYDAKSIMFGMNKFNNSSSAWTSNKWTPSMAKNLPILTGN